MAVSKLVSFLELHPHPEGGFFKETFRDDSFRLHTSSLPPHYKVDRSVSTAIYFLLPTGSISRLHRIPSAEVWHFYQGDPLTVLEIDEQGHVKHTILGADLEAGQRLQYTVPPLVWFGAYPTKDVETVSADGCTIVKAPPRDAEQHFSLVGCTVAPAFEFDDFEMAERSQLVALFPHAKACIELLTDPDSN